MTNTPVPTPKASILLVDDRPANLVALEAILEPLGQRMVTATSGEEALRRLLADDFAVILLDVQMPGLDGFKVAAIVRERKRTRYTPIIFLTALSREASHIFRGYEQGAVDYLVKPFDPQILRSKVSVFVELWQKTELVRQQAALIAQRDREALERRSAVRFRGLTESMPHCVWTVGLDGRVTYANRTALQFSPQIPHAGPGFAVRIHPDDQATAEQVWRRAVDGGEPFEVQTRMQRLSDGLWRWHLWRGVPERDEEERKTGWIVSATDIDDEKRAEEALRRTQQELRLANEAKDAFLAAASHELRTPLAAAKGHAHLALKKLDDDTSVFPGRAFGVILRQIDRMTKLVEDLLDVSRLQAGRLALEPEPFDLPELVRETSERVAVLSEQHALELVMPDTLAVVADRHRMDQVLTNLLTNAIRYSPNGGEVQVHVSGDEDWVRLSVSDRGVGIPKEKQAVIFERFGRAHGSRYGGLGLGLTIVQGIVEQHGGRIWVESDGVENRGSTFHVEFPRHPASALRSPPRPAPSEANQPRPEQTH